MIANDIADAMGKDTTKITIIDDEKETALPEMSKDKAAQMLVARLAAALQTATLKKAAAPASPAAATATTATAAAHAPAHESAHDSIITVQDDDEPAPAATPMHKPEEKKIIPAAV